MSIYSHSRLSTYENCPLQFKLNYLDKIKRYEQGIEAFMGSRFHEVMERLYKDIRCREYSLEDLLKYYNDIWAKEYNDKILVVRKDRTAEDYRVMGEKCIEDYYKRYHPFDQSRVIGVEKLIMVDLDGTGKYKVRGYVDRIGQAYDGTYEIHDYKTSGNLPEQKYLDADRQLALYQIGLESMWNDVDKVNLIWHYVMFDKEMVSTRTREELNALKHNTISLIDEIESTEDYLPKESSLCEWCAYPDLCPKRKHLYKVSDMSPNEYKNEPGVKLVEKYSELENDKNKLKEQMSSIEDEQNKIKEAAIEYAQKEQVEIIDGPGARLKVEIKEENKAPTRSEDPEAWEELREVLIKEDKYEEVSTVNSNMLNYRIRNKVWPSEIIDKISKYLVKKTTETVRLLKKQDKG